MSGHEIIEPRVGNEPDDALPPEPVASSEALNMPPLLIDDEDTILPSLEMSTERDTAFPAVLKQE